MTHDGTHDVTHDVGENEDRNEVGNEVNAVQHCPHCRQPIALITLIVAPSAAHVTVPTLPRSRPAEGGSGEKKGTPMTDVHLDATDAVELAEGISPPGYSASAVGLRPILDVEPRRLHARSGGPAHLEAAMTVQQPSV